MSRHARSRVLHRAGAGGAVVALAALLACGGVQALPIQLTAAEFAAQTAGNPSLLVEDFQGFPTGTVSNPFTFLNGTYSTTVSNGVILASGTFCGPGAPPDQCLTNQSIAGIRTFDAFPAGTAYWSADSFYIDPSNTFTVNVTGGSGVLSFSSTGQSFWGFTDPLGLTSVAFDNLGSGGGTSFGNYSFDNVTTASGVPEPGTLALLGLGLAALGAARKRG